MIFTTTNLSVFQRDVARNGQRGVVVELEILWDAPTDWKRLNRLTTVVNGVVRKPVRMGACQPLGRWALLGSEVEGKERSEVGWSPVWERLNAAGRPITPVPRRPWQIWSFDDGRFVLTDRDVWVPFDAFRAENREGIFSLPNVEHRRECIRYWSFDALMPFIPHKVIDEQGGYQVLQVDNLSTSNREWVNALFLKMVNPSTGDIHIEGLDPELADRTVKGALAYRNAGLVPEVIT